MTTPPLISQQSRHASPRGLGRVAPRRGRSADWWFLAAPCVALPALLAVCVGVGADVKLSALCYCVDSRCWPLADVEPWGSLYRLGCLPAVGLGVAGLGAALLGMVRPAWRPLRRPGLFLAVALLVGPGLLVNFVLKPGVGRPRPKETVVFGGAMPFGYAGGPTAETQSNSFPSGHAAMGFFLMTPALVLYRRRPRAAAAVLVVGGSYGVLMSTARIVQGAHFVTDVLASALLVHVTAMGVLLAGDCCAAALRGRRRVVAGDQPPGERLRLSPAAARVGGRNGTRHAA